MAACSPLRAADAGIKAVEPSRVYLALLFVVSTFALPWACPFQPSGGQGTRRTWSRASQPRTADMRTSAPTLTATGCQHFEASQLRHIDTAGYLVL